MLNCKDLQSESSFSEGASRSRFAAKIPTRSDVVCPEHTVELFRLLGGGVAGDLAGLPRSQLAVLLGTTSMTLVDRAGWQVSMMTQFLDGKDAMGK